MDFVERTDDYSQLLSTRNKIALNDTVYFTINMIAVHPKERGRGHLREMLNNLISDLKENTRAEYIYVTTYNESKVELYQHLNFSVSEKMESEGMKAWVLKMPID